MNIPVAVAVVVIVATVYLLSRFITARLKRLRIYELAHKKLPHYDECDIAYSIGRGSKQFLISTGIGHSAMGGPCSVEELLSDWGRNHLKRCDALWLVPLLERFAAGEPISTEAVLQAYEQEHGRQPPFRDVTR